MNGEPAPGQSSGPTTIGLLIIPALYYVIQSMTEWVSAKLGKKSATAEKKTG